MTNEQYNRDMKKKDKATGIDLIQCDMCHQLVFKNDIVASRRKDGVWEKDFYSKGKKITHICDSCVGFAASYYKLFRNRNL